MLIFGKILLIRLHNGLIQTRATQNTSRALFISSSECSVLLVCSVWCSDDRSFHEKSVDSMSNIAAFPSLSHKLISGGWSSAGVLTISPSGSCKSGPPALSNEMLPQQETNLCYNCHKEKNWQKLIIQFNLCYTCI